nr:MAG TPA: hypothetical protein [Caudoviricetes sp.]
MLSTVSELRSLASSRVRSRLRTCLCHTPHVARFLGAYRHYFRSGLPCFRDYQR